MISVEQNERLTKVSKGTPCGELMRRYWHPVAASVRLKDKRIMRVRIMGEDLVLFRDLSGNLGLVQERCPHRSASLALGLLEENGIRCRYHGWQFTCEGVCTEQPFEDTVGTGSFKEHVSIDAYKVQELGGLIFAYLGPDPAPLLPRWDALVEREHDHFIQLTVLPCNWLQCQENSADPVHFEWLHAHGSNEIARRLGMKEEVMTPRKHLKIDFDLFEYGIMKRRLLEGDDPETSPDWNVGHPMLFPNILAGGNLQWRVPMDDEHTFHVSYGLRPRPEGAPEQREIPTADLPYADDNGEFILTGILNQDLAAWITQGPVTPRHLENLGRSDRGILMLRRWLEENMDRVARGEEPGALIRDPALNEPFFNIPGMKGQRLTTVQKMTPFELGQVLVSAAAAES